MDRANILARNRNALQGVRKNKDIENDYPTRRAPSREPNR